jgi:hypothetical protein
MTAVIEVDTQDDQVVAIRVGGESLRSDDGETWFLPKGLISTGILVNQLPEDASFEICERIEGDVIVMETIPIQITRVGSDCVRLDVEDSGTRKYWDGPVGFKPYMEAKKAVVDERAAQMGDLVLDHYEDDGAWIHLAYSAEIDAEKLQTAVHMAEQIVTEIDGAADIRVGVELWKPMDAQDERDFTLRMVLPIVRKLRFQNVRYHHGRREFGRDVLFARFTEFQELEHWAAQVKFGDVNGGASSEIDNILGQIDDAFKMPFYDLYTRQQQRISKLAIIISGRFTENAIEKICEKVESHAIRNNIVFLDGEKLQTLAERFALRGVR